MQTWNEVVRHQILRHINQVKKTTQPLKDIFGIDYFTYHRIDYKGRYTVLLDRPDWAEHYVTEKLYQQDPYLQHPDSYHSGFCLIEMNGSASYKEEILQAGSKFNLDLGVCLIQKHAEAVEFFGFAGSKQNSALHKLYLNHQALLESFACYFKEQHLQVLKNLDQAPSLAMLKGEHLNKTPVLLQLNDHAHHSFLHALGLSQYTKKMTLLSAQEKQCLKWLLKNKSAKETGSLMGLSQRTVEFYFENIKNKLACSSKAEVFEIATNLQSLGLLP